MVPSFPTRGPGLSLDLVPCLEVKGEDLRRGFFTVEGAHELMGSADRAAEGSIKVSRSQLKDEQEGA